MNGRHGGHEHGGHHHNHQLQPLPLPTNRPSAAERAFQLQQQEIETLRAEVMRLGMERAIIEHRISLLLINVEA